jgi:potassium efflux system protein
MTDMKKILQAALTVWLGVVMLVLAGLAPAHAQSVLEQVMPGQAQQQEEQQPSADNDNQAGPQQQTDQPKEPAAETPAAQAPPAAVPPGIAEAAKRGIRQAQQFGQQLEEIEGRLANPSLNRDDLSALRNEIETIRADVREADLAIEPPLTQINDQISRLGPAPKDGESEPETVAAQRAQLNAARDELAGARAQLALVTGTAEQLSASAASRERSLFFDNLLGSSRSVFNPLLWTDGVAQVGDFSARAMVLVKSFNDKLAREQGAWAIWLFYGSLLLLTVTTIVLCRMIARRARHGSPGEAEFQKWLRTVIVPIGYTLVTMLAVIVFVVILENLSPNNPRMERVIEALGGALVGFAFWRGLVRSVTSPTRPEWRAVPLSSHRASKWLALSTLAFGLVAAGQFLKTLAEVLNMDSRFDMAVNALISIVLLLITAQLILTGRSESNSEEQPEQGLKPGFAWASYLVQPAWLLVASAAVALVLGYVSFGSYLMQNLYIIAPVVALLYCIRRLSDAFVAQSLRPKSRIAKTLKSAFSMSERGINRAGIALNAGVDLMLLLLGLPLVLGLTSLTWVDVRSWLMTAFFGFKVGDITISLSSILLALVVFTIGLVLTRLVTGWLDRRILTPTDMDAGVRNSLRTAAGYLATVIVLLMAFAAAGVDFSNIAIVAGALSVGIGFGLQSIVNNFVSGLILLAERPIKVGDWVQVAGGEGTVRQINVRSTEIETFDRCSIIVPNSSLISDTVSNWTHGDLMGRVRVAIGVSYDADPQQVHDILLKCASEHERALDFPAPTVLFKDFGASSLDFEVRVFINDVNWVAFVASDLRYTIHKALKEAGIEIPFPQRDVNVRGLKEAVADSVADAVAAGSTRPVKKQPAANKRATKRAREQARDDGGDE